MYTSVGVTVDVGGVVVGSVVVFSVVDTVK